MNTNAVDFFFVPFHKDELISEIGKRESNTPSIIVEHAESFKRNLIAVLSTISIPFYMAVASIESQRFQALHTAELIRGRPDDSEQGKIKAWEKAQERMKEESENPEAVQKMADRVLNELLRLVIDEDFASGAAELLRQGTVLTWGALEVLVRDLFVALLNANPAIALDLLQHESTKRFFDIKALSLSTLAEYHFDISKCMGSILAESRDITTIPAMKIVLAAMFPKDESLLNALNSRELWIINQRRHLIVHRRGIVDAEYIHKTGDSLQIGTPLVVAPKEIEGYLHVVRDVGIGLIEAVAARFSASCNH